jgi:tRNA-binding protein
MHILHDPLAPVLPEVSFADFLKLDIRVGAILEASVFQEARNPAYRLLIDFGAAIGHKKSVAQITENYTVDDLPGRAVLGVVNFPPRQIGPARSEVLVLGFADSHGAIILATPASNVPEGARLA